MKYLLMVMLLVVSCSSPMEVLDEPISVIKIIPNLVQDENGYYHLYVERMNQQTLHRLSLETNFDESTRVEWSANSSWIHTHVGIDFDIPVINFVSYTSIDDGTAQTMFAPVYELIGDTVLVVVTSEDIADSVSIVLE